MKPLENRTTNTTASSNGLAVPGQAPPSQPPDSTGGRQLPDGYLLQNRYRILSKLTVGGMSVVYKAQDLRFSKVTRVCVVKEMVNTASDPQVRAMIVRSFEREANILATLSHPAIVQVYDFFTEGARSYLVLEYVDGKNLEDLLAETAGFFSEEQVVSWAIQVCEVMNYLHNQKPQPIVFRDIKPPNIMLDKHNRIRLIDFGIAKMFQSGQKGTMIGTEGYSPPEQYRGIADPRVDVYALGATMHHLLSKQDPRLEPPFSFHERPISETNPSVSDELVKVTDQALQYDRDKRYSSIEEMKQALMGLSSARGAHDTTPLDTPAVISSEGVGPTSVLWRFACEDGVGSSPVVNDSVAYVGAYDRNLYAINAENGKLVWKYATEGGVASSPCVHEGRVFIGSADRRLYAINADSGRISWICPTEGKIWSSPRIAFGHILFGSDDRNLYAVNIHSGRVAWTFPTEGEVRSSPAVGDDVIYVGCEEGLVYAVETSGKLRHHFSARRGITSIPALTEEMVYIGSRDRYVYGLYIRSLQLAWRYRTEGPVVSSPAVSDGRIFIGSADGNLYALDARDGRLAWRYTTGDQVASNPAVFEGKVYFGSVDGEVYSLDARTGNLRWRFKTGGPVTSSPAVMDGVVYIGSADHYVYALSA